MRAGAAFVVLLIACHPEERAGDIASSVMLSPIESCSALESHLEEEAISVLDAEIDARLEKGFFVPLEGEPIRSPRVLGRAPFETIAVHGDRVLLLQDGSIRAIRARPLEQIATTPIEGDPIGVFTAGDRIFVLTFASGRTRVTLLAADLAPLRTIELAGRPLDAFASNDALTLVLSGGLEKPPPVAEELSFVAMESYRALREREIRDRTLDDWLVPDDLPRDCTAFYRAPGAPMYLDLVRIVRLDATDLYADVTSVIGRAAIAVVEAEQILIALEHRWRVPRPGQIGYSYLFTFGKEGLPRAAGGVEGVPAAESIELSSAAIRMITMIDRRVSDPINTWGRVVRAHRVETIDIAGQELISRSRSPLFAEDRSLRALLMTERRAIAATADRIYAFDLDRLDTFAAFALEHPIDRLAEAGGPLLATSTRIGGIEIALLDPAALDRSISSRFVSNLLPLQDIALSIDPAGRIAVPEIGSPENEAPQTPSIGVRLLSIDGDALTSTASIDLTPLHAVRSGPPRLLYGAFVNGRPLAISDAGVGAAADANALTTEHLLFD